jgi:hypothetical protein
MGLFMDGWKDEDADYSEKEGPISTDVGVDVGQVKKDGCCFECGSTATFVLFNVCWHHDNDNTKGYFATRKRRLDFNANQMVMDFFSSGSVH